MSEKSSKWIAKKKRIFCFFNIPIFVSLPVLIYTPVLQSFVAPSKLNIILVMLTGVDIMMLVDTIVTYKLMQSMVTQITYKPKTDDIEITHLNSKWLSPVTEVMKPQEILKCKGKSLNPFVGYKVI